MQNTSSPFARSPGSSEGESSLISACLSYVLLILGFMPHHIAKYDMFGWGVAKGISWNIHCCAFAKDKAVQNHTISKVSVCLELRVWSDLISGLNCWESWAEKFDGGRARRETSQQICNAWQHKTTHFLQVHVDCGSCFTWMREFFV